MRSDYDTFPLISFILSGSIMLHVFVTLCKQKLFVTKKLLCSVRIEPVLCPIHECTLAVLFWRQIRLFWIPFLRAMVLNRDPEAKSLWFETRSGKNSAASQLLGLSARKFRRWSFTCVNKAANWAPLVMSSVFSTPFFQWLDCRSIVVLLICQWGVRAKPRNVKITQETDNFLGSRPCPFFQLLDLFRHASFSVCRSLRPRVSAKFWAHIEAWLWSVAIPIPFGTQLDWVRMPAKNRMKLKYLPIG